MNCSGATIRQRIMRVSLRQDISDECKSLSFSPGPGAIRAASLSSCTELRGFVVMLLALVVCTTGLDSFREFLLKSENKLAKWLLLEEMLLLVVYDSGWNR